MNRDKLLTVSKKAARFLLGIPLTLAAFYFIGLFLWNARSDILTSLTRANYPMLILGIVFFALFFFLKNIIWIRILQNLGAKDLDTSKSFFLLSFSETKRYIPGNIFAFVSRVKSYTEANIPAKLLVKSLVIEALLLMIPSMIVSIPGLLFIYPRLQQQFPEYAQYVLPGVALITVFAIAVMLAAIMVARKKLGANSITFKSIVPYLDLTVLSALSWISFGIGNYLVASSIHVLDVRYLAQFVSFFVLSWFIGYISIITPMGLGVREGIMIVGLAPFAALSITSLIALFSRIAFMAGEFLFLLLSFLLYKNKQLQSLWKYIQQQGHFVILWITIVSYSIYFSYVSIIKYDNFFMGKFDLGNMDQTVWNTLNGRIFLFSNPDGSETISRLAFHADFILILLAPLYIIWEDPRVLLILQSVVLSLGAFFVYRIAYVILKDKNLSLIFGLVYLFNPLVQKQNLYDFHAVTLATTFLLATWYFMLKMRWKLMILFLIFAVLTKENVYLISTIFGLYLIYKKQWKLGISIVTLSLSIFFLLMKVIIPEMRGGEHFAIQFLSNFGDSLGSAVIRIITDPLYTLSVFFENNGLNYLKMLLLPVGFLPFGAPFYLIFSAPDITKNLLSDNPNFRASYYQYNAEIIPFLIISSIYSAKILLKRIPKKVLLYYLVISSLYGNWLYGALPIGQSPYVDIYTNPRENAKVIADYLKTIDSQKSVTATNNLGSHLSRRENIYVLPNGIDEVDYVLFLNTDWYEPLDELNRQVEVLKQDSRFRISYQVGSFIAFERVN